MQVPENRKEQFSGNSESKETETRKQLQGPKMMPVIGRKKREEKGRRWKGCRVRRTRNRRGRKRNARKE